MSFALNYFVGGLDVTGYHVFNLAVHIVNSLLVYALVLLTFRTPRMKGTSIVSSSGLVALGAALLFVVHPVQTQAVTYIVQRLTSLAVMWYLLSLCLYAGWRLWQEAHGGKGLLLYGFTLISIVLAMKTKEIAFTLPLMIVLYDFYFFRERKTLWLVPVLLTLLIIPVSMLNLGKPVGTLLSDVSTVTRVQAQTSRWVYLMTQFTVIATYIRLLFFPINQNLDYDYPLAQGFFTLPVFMSFVFLLFVVLAGAYFFVRSNRNNTGGGAGFRLISFGIFWFFITLSVESSIIPIVDPIFEHRVYLPSVGFCVALVTGIVMIMKAVKNKKAVYAAAAVVVVILTVLGGATYARNRVWQNEIRLWQDVIKKSPSKARAHYNLGVAYTREGNIEVAIKQFLTAIRLDPGLVDAYYNLGLAYAGQGRIRDAIREYKTAIELAPDYFMAHNNLANTYLAQDRIEDAIREYRKAIKIDPGFANVHYNLGLAYVTQGRSEDAIKEFVTAIQLDPDFSPAHYDLGVSYRMEGRLEDARKEFQTVLRLEPNHRAARENLEMLKRLREE
jgi:Flp pilus assembly protein TadD